jgi:hypothetical protein
MPNVEMIEFVARALGELREDVVFLGGAVVALLITDPGAAPVRFTADVDVIVDLSSKVAYDRLAQRLRALGFREDASEGAPRSSTRSADVRMIYASISPTGSAVCSDRDGSSMPCPGTCPATRRARPGFRSSSADSRRSLQGAR